MTDALLLSLTAALAWGLWQLMACWAWAWGMWVCRELGA